MPSTPSLIGVATLAEVGNTRTFFGIAVGPAGGVPTKCLGRTVETHRVSEVMIHTVVHDISLDLAPLDTLYVFGMDTLTKVLQAKLRAQSTCVVSGLLKAHMRPEGLASHSVRELGAGAPWAWWCWGCATQHFLQATVYTAMGDWI